MVTIDEQCDTEAATGPWLQLVPDDLWPSPASHQNITTSLKHLKPLMDSDLFTLKVELNVTFLFLNSDKLMKRSENM